MAGHSQFKNIMHRKGAQDAKRAKLFAKLAREITVAAKSGMPDPKQNPRLRNAMINARHENMPNDRINKALQKATSNDDNTQYDEMRYEGIANNGVFLIIETLTDNKNRTASNIRTIFQKHGGGLGTQGSASHNFLQKGIIKVNKNEISYEKIFELASDAGADDCIPLDEYYEIHTNKDEIYDVKNIMEKEISNFISTEIEWVPINKIKLNQEDKEKMIKFLEILEDDDDVQNIFINAE